MNSYAKRREKLSHALKENSALVLFSGCEVKRSADSVFDFSVNKNFFYLTGIKQDGSILVIKKLNGIISETIFTTAYDALKEVWTGRRLKPEGATRISGIAKHINAEEFSQFIDEIKKDVKTIYLDLEEGIFNDKGVLMTVYASELKSKYGFEVEDIYQDIVRLRMVKDEEEIGLIKESIRLTAQALKEATKNLKPGLFEYEVGALFEYHIKKEHGILGFNTIAASGENAVILHYPDLDAKLKDNDLLLLDLGGHNNMYTADISRTFPVNGRFTPLQEKIYAIVLACNKAVINLIKPGLTILDLQNFTKEFLKNELVKEGIIKEEDDIFNYYYHGVSHHLGLDTHDPGDRSLPLEKGNVITVEPGLYFAEHGIGVRIEDNVVVTESGAHNLSREIPKEIKDIIR